MRVQRIPITAAGIKVRVSCVVCRVPCLQIEPEICIIIPLPIRTMLCHTNQGISFNSAAKGRAVSINSLCSSASPGSIDSPNVAQANTEPVLCASFCDSINLHVAKDCTHYVQQSRQSKASIRCISPQRLSSSPHGDDFPACYSWHFCMQLQHNFYLLTLSSLFFSLWFALLLWLQLLMQNQMHAEWGPFA